MKEFGERAAGITALLHWWNEAELRQRPHSPARLRALRYGAWTREPAASRTRLAVEACWNLCIPVAPFAIKTLKAACVVHLCGCTPVVRDLSGASGIATKKVIPHMVAEL